MTIEQSAPHSAVSLSSVYKHPDRYRLLYALLSERDQDMSISHRAMPTMEEHALFVDRKPYAGWYFIEAAGPVSIGLGPVGAIYLTWLGEIGVFLFAHCQGRGYGTRAVKLLMQKHRRKRYLANINPRNERSAGMFSRMGFKLIQHTYELRL